MNCLNESFFHHRQKDRAFGDVTIEGSFVDAGKYLKFQDLHLSIGAGEALAIVGLADIDTNGIGNIFNPISGIEMEGSIQIGKRRYYDRRFLAHQIYRIGYRDTLINGFSVIDNVFLRDRSYTMFNSKYACQKLKAILEYYGIHIDPYVTINQLSISEQIIVEIIRACIHIPNLCVFEDVFSQISDEYYESILRMIVDMKTKFHIPILYLTTHFENAINFSDRIIVVRSQNVIGEFSADSVKKNPKPLMYCLSGWQELNYNQNDNISNLQNLLLDMHNKIEFTEELKKILIFLADDLKRILSPTYCTIVVTDDDLGTSILVGDNTHFSQEALKVLKAPLASKTSEGSYRTNDAIKMEKISENHYCMYESVSLNNELVGIILVGFRESRSRSEVDHASLILNNFAREMAVAIETSRLVGNSVLLQESHHRIKNNLQIIVNLLFMQKLALLEHGSGVTDAIDKVINQVKSIALIHDLLSNGCLGKNVINLKEIIREIVLFYKNTRIEFDLDLEDISIPYNKASTIALIVNELITNCVKHAFPDQRDKRVGIKCSNQESDLCIVVSDNGVGFPLDKSSQKHGIGSNIINTAVMKMGGSVQERNLLPNGCAQTEIRFVRSGVYE